MLNSQTATDMIAMYFLGRAVKFSLPKCHENSIQNSERSKMKLYCKKREIRSHYMMKNEMMMTLKLPLMTKHLMGRMQIIPFSSVFWVVFMSFFSAISQISFPTDQYDSSAPPWVLLNFWEPRRSVFKHDSRKGDYYTTTSR